jgi:hypothetical protein
MRCLSCGCCSLYWLYIEIMQLYSLTEYALLYSWKVLVSGLLSTISSISSHSTLASTIFNVCMQHESACFSQIMMNHLKHTVRMCLIWISVLTIPQCSRSIAVTKAIQDIHIYEFCINKSKHFCCHCSRYWHFCLSLNTVLHHLFPWSQCRAPVKRSQ